MNIKNTIELIKSGLTNKEIARIIKCNNDNISKIRLQYYLPNAKIIRKLNNNPNFKDYFIDIFNNNTNIKCLNMLKQNKFFDRIIISKHIITSLRYFYGLEPKMFEMKYNSNSDRIKGYIIRNTKYTSKRRNIKFDLKYNDFDLPEYCPILNIKLTFGSETDGNDPSHASLDRINNNIGYIKGNVIVMSKLANAMKNAANFNQLELFSKNIIKLINYYKIQGALGSITDVFPDIILKT